MDIHPGRLEIMPSQHRHRGHLYRVEDDLHARAAAAVEEAGGTLNGHIEAFLHWVAGDTDALPPRPERPRSGPG